MSKFELKTLVEDFKSDESGATAIEYAIIAAGISIAIISGLAIVSGGVSALFNLVSGAL